MRPCDLVFFLFFFILKTSEQVDVQGAFPAVMFFFLFVFFPPPIVFVSSRAASHEVNLIS